jgi:hypothetical protein
MGRRTSRHLRTFIPVGEERAPGFWLGPIARKQSFCSCAETQSTKHGIGGKNLRYCNLEEAAFKHGLLQLANLPDGALLPKSGLPANLLGRCRTRRPAQTR